MATFEEKAKALAEHLGISVDDVKIEDDPYYDWACEYTTPEGVFTVMDYDESMEAVKQDIENLVDDIGLESFSEEFQDWVVDNALTPSDWFEDVCEESSEFYASDIAYESDDTYGSRLAQECVDAGIISDDDFENGEYVGSLDLTTEYSDYLFNRDREDYDGNFYRWYVDNFGSSEIRSLIKEGKLSFDIDTIAEAVVDADGFGNSLASWDGDTVELSNGLYAYKQSE